jgi:hypothetical protein
MSYDSETLEIAEALPFGSLADRGMQGCLLNAAKICWRNLSFLLRHSRSLNLYLVATFRI